MPLQALIIHPTAIADSIVAPALFRPEFLHSLDPQRPFVAAVSLTRPLDTINMVRPVANRERKSVMKVVEVYQFRVVVPVGYEAKLLHSIEKVAPLTYGNYDRVAWVSSPGMEQYRVLPGADAASPDDTNVIAAEGDLVKVKCVAIEFSIPRDDALKRSVIEDGIYRAHPWVEPVVSVYPAHETRRWEA